MTIIDQLEFDRAQRGAPANGMELAAVNAERPWWDSAMGRLKAFAASGLDFDAYDLTEAGVGDPDHANRWGALFNAARTQVLIDRTGEDQRTRATPRLPPD